jgi:hypothetical protein
MTTLYVHKKYFFKIRQRKTKGLLFKIYFEKVFDSINYQFHKEILKVRGFGNK